VKVFVLAPRENWVCDRIAQEFVSACEDVCVQNPAQADVIWLLAGWCWNHIHPEILKNKKVIVTVHHIVPDKFTDEKKNEFIIRDKFVDAYHVPNKYTQQFIERLTDKPIYVLPYWIDDKKWNILEKEECKKRIGLPENVTVIGSFQRDSEGESGLPKLEKGPDVLCDLVEEMAKTIPVVVLLGGWRRKYVTNRLSNAGINFVLHEMVSQHDLEVMYNACDLYMVCSRYEGGPQAVLEASKMRVPIISSRVGISELVLHENCVYDLEEKSKIAYPSKLEVDYNENNVKNFFLSKVKEEYKRMLFGVL